jgi:carbon storage regulator
MLVLSRRKGETITLPGLDIQISVLRLSGSRVKLGIAAPQEVAVRREELFRSAGEQAEQRLTGNPDRFDDV